MTLTNCTRFKRFKCIKTEHFHHPMNIFIFLQVAILTEKPKVVSFVADVTTTTRTSTVPPTTGTHTVPLAPDHHAQTPAPFPNPGVPTNPTVPSGPVQPLHPINPTQDVNTALHTFYTSEIAPAMNNSVNHVVNTINHGMSEINQSINLLVAHLKANSDSSKSDASKGTDSSGSASGSASFGTGKSTGGNTAHPFPGKIEDYNVLIPIAIGASRCCGCCTCKKQEMCLFNLFIQLQIIVEKYPKWTPPNPFTVIQNPLLLKGSKSNCIGILEMLLSDLGKKRCKSCYLCKEIDNNYKIAFMFNTDVLGALFDGGDKKNKEFLMAYMMNTQGIEQQMGTLPFLLNLLGSRGSSMGCCSNSSQSGCKSSGQSCSGQQSSQTQSGQRSGQCSGNQNSSSCPNQPINPSIRPNPSPCPSKPSVPITPNPTPVKPENKPDGSFYGVSNTNGQVYGTSNNSQQGYGLPAPDTGSGSADDKPAYGMRYGNYH